MFGQVGVEPAVFGQVGVEVELHALAGGLLGTDQLGDIAAATHRGELQVLGVLAVGADLGRIKTIDQVVAALLDDVGAKQPGRALQVAVVQVEQRRETGAGRVKRLQPDRAVVVALEVLGRRGGACVLARIFHECRTG